MKLPNKLFSYHESVIGKFPIILSVMEQEKYLSIFELYIKVIDNFESITEFSETVECLYMLNKIDYSYVSRRIRYVV